MSRRIERRFYAKRAAAMRKSARSKIRMRRGHGNAPRRTLTRECLPQLEWCFCVPCETRLPNLFHRKKACVHLVLEFFRPAVTGCQLRCADSTIHHALPLLRQLRLRLRHAGCAALGETPSGAKDYFFSGYNLMLRKNTSAPSDWNKIFPLEGNACEPSLANFPLTNCLT